VVALENSVIWCCI